MKIVKYKDRSIAVDASIQNILTAFLAFGYGREKTAGLTVNGRTIKVSVKVKKEYSGEVERLIQVFNRELNLIPYGWVNPTYFNQMFMLAFGCEIKNFDGETLCMEAQGGSYYGYESHFRKGDAFLCIQE